MLTTKNDIQHIQNIHLQAFGDTECPVISQLVEAGFCRFLDAVQIDVIA